jgi:integrase
LTSRHGYDTILAVEETDMKTKKVTFEQQAERFLAEGASRKRSPLRPASVRTYRAVIDNLVTLIGKTPLQDVGNKVVSDVVTKLSEQGYSAASIALNVVIIKKIRKSAVNEEGDQLYPATWNADMIDAPEAEPVTEASTINQEALQESISRAETQDKVLYALLAGTGLRIAEAQAVQVIADDGVSTVWIPSESKIIVRQQMTRNGLAPTKTKAGVREVDLAPELNEFLVKIAGTVKGFMFPGNYNGYLSRLEKNGITAGFHAFRRFRITHLNRMSTPSGLEYFWTGHAAGDVHGRYIRFGSEIEARKSEAARVGLGFKLPEQS